MTTHPVAWHRVTHITRAPVPAPTTITELIRRFEAGLDEGPACQRMVGPK